MDKRTGLKIRKPATVWEKALKADASKLAAALTRGGGKIATGDLVGAVTEALSA